MSKLTDHELFNRQVRRVALDKLNRRDQEAIKDLARQLSKQVDVLSFDGALEVLSQIGKEFVDE